MTREHRRTKCRRRPRRGAESLRISHAVDSVGVERRVSPPPRHGAMLTFRPSLPDQMTQETGKRPNGAAAAILAVRRQGLHGMSTTKGFRASARPPPTLVRHCLRVILANSSLKEAFSRCQATQVIGAGASVIYRTGSGIGLFIYGLLAPTATRSFNKIGFPPCGEGGPAANEI